jgi:hypothetical protein
LAISTDSNEEESDYDQALDNLNQANDPMVRIFALGEINNYMRDYSNRSLTKLDKILLKGFYQRKPEHPDEISVIPESPNFFDQRPRSISAKERLLGALSRTENLDNSSRVDTHSQLNVDNSISLKTKKKYGR